ncbi:hypothetical protein ACFVL4_24490 [Bacillus subtilis]|uniref:hypothetical protein n=1 Tax=Bacillus subtilis TaxID=1423 RepID=UPI00254FAF3F|nr:hypothetical protein [Bacillus subtilis]MDK7656999.1 hypothetical protein [Bacillus subtilis]
MNDTDRIIINGFKEMVAAKDDIKRLCSQQHYEGFIHAVSHFREILESAQLLKKNGSELVTEVEEQEGFGNSNE